MTTLTVEEATSSLGRWVDLALAGEQVQIRKGDAVVELRPAAIRAPAAREQLMPREALRRLQEESQLTPEAAERYLHEVHEERLATDDRRPA